MRAGVLRSALALALLATACAPTPTAQDDDRATIGPTRSPGPLDGNCQPVAAGLSVAVDLRADTVLESLDTPWAVAFAADGRVFVSERGGTIRVWRSGEARPSTWLTLPATEQGEGGLLGLALDADFAQTHFVYAAYTYGVPGGLRNRLVRLRDDPATNRGAVDRTLMEDVPGSGVHDGGRVAIGPDRKVYWALGDASQPNQAQDPRSSSGKILRLNTDGTIPGDNPIAGSATWSYGHRNPQGIAWQPCTAHLYETEHGPSAGGGNTPLTQCCRDELNFVEPGANYGWPLISADDAREGMRTPVRHSGPSDTWAPSGMTFVTNGPWAGSLVFVGLRGQALYRVALDPADPRRALSFEAHLKNEFGRLRDVVEGPDGALYLLTNNTDGRGTPGPQDDRLLRLRVSAR